MDFVQLSLLFIMIFGIFFVVISVSLIGKGGSNDLYFENKNTIEVMQRSLDDMDKNIEEFDKASKLVFTEIDEKYQELLFLYSLIDTKKSEVADLLSQRKAPVFSTETPIEPTEKSPNFVPSSPHLHEILQLHSSGIPVSEIAKNLAIGVGEVRLIIELGKK